MAGRGGITLSFSIIRSKYFISLLLPFLKKGGHIKLLVIVYCLLVYIDYRITV